MDIRMPSVVGKAGGGSPVAALPKASQAISAQARSVISEIAASTQLSDGQRTALVQAVARFDQAVANQSVRQALFSQVEGLGTYLRNTSTTSWPRWQQLTALRVYGLNIEQGKKSPVEEVAAQQARQHLEALAQSNGVSLGQAMARAQAAQPQQVEAAPTPAVAVVTKAVQEQIRVDSAPKAAPVRSVKVDTVV